MSRVVVTEGVDVMHKHSLFTTTRDSKATGYSMTCLYVYTQSAICEHICFTITWLISSMVEHLSYKTGSCLFDSSMSHRTLLCVEYVEVSQLEELSQRASDLNLTINLSNGMYEVRNTRVTLMCLKTLDEVSIFIHGYAQGKESINDTTRANSKHP